MKKVSEILGNMQASLNGSLDGLEFDNTCDVIEKSTVIEMVKDLMAMVSEAQLQVKNLSLSDVSKSEGNGTVCLSLYSCKHKQKRGDEYYCTTKDECFKKQTVC